MRAVAIVLLVAALVTACKQEAPPAPATIPAEAAAPSAPVALKDLQGSWKIVSSSGKLDEGQVFREMVGELVRVEADVLIVPQHAHDISGAPKTFEVTKKITLLPGTSPQAIDLELTPDAKGWSRVGVVTVVGDVMILSVNFPQKRRPADLRPASDGREVVRLERVGL